MGSCPLTAGDRQIFETSFLFAFQSYASPIGARRTVREVGHPYHIGSRRDHIAIEVRVNRRIVVAIRRANIPLAKLDTEAIGPHDAGDTLVIYEVASSLKLVCYAPVSVTGQLVLDVLDDCNEFAVAEVQGSRGWGVSQILLVNLLLTTTVEIPLPM